MHNWIKSVCFLTLTVGLLIFLWRADRSLTQASNDLHILSVGAGGIVGNLAGTTIKLNSLIDKNSNYYDQTIQEIPRTQREFRKVLSNLDTNLNDPSLGTIPNLNKSIAVLTVDLNDTLMGMDKVESSANSTLSASIHVIDSLNSRISDPKIDDVLTHIDLTALHIDDATNNANQAIANVNHITAYYNKTLTSPKGFLSTIGKGLFSLIVPGADVYTAYRAGTASATVAGSAVIKKMKSKGNSQ
jgi:hypothetical protein